MGELSSELPATRKHLYHGCAKEERLQAMYLRHEKIGLIRIGSVCPRKFYHLHVLASDHKVDATRKFPPSS